MYVRIAHTLRDVTSAPTKGCYHLHATSSFDCFPTPNFTNFDPLHLCNESSYLSKSGDIGKFVTRSTRKSHLTFASRSSFVTHWRRKVSPVFLLPPSVGACFQKKKPCQNINLVRSFFYCELNHASCHF